MAVEGATPHLKRATPVIAWISSGLAIASIWISVVLSSLLAPDFVSGSQQEHLQLVAWGDWVWGLVASALVVLAVLDGIRLGIAHATPWVVLAAGVSLVWLGVLAISACTPALVTGTDPTRIPLAAMGVPIVGVFLTWFVCTLVKTSFEQEAA